MVDLVCPASPYWRRNSSDFDQGWQVVYDLKLDDFSWMLIVSFLKRFKYIGSVSD
jgi:hypothetical protein